MMPQIDFFPKHSLKTKAEVNPMTSLLSWETHLYLNTKPLWTRFESVGVCNCMHTFKHA